MKMKMHYPIAITATTNSLKSEKLLYCMPEIEFDLPETTEAESPVAFVTTVPDDNGRSEETLYRLHEGKLYTKLDGRGDGDFDGKPFLTRHPLFGTMAAEAIRRGEGLVKTEIWPDGAYLAIRNDRIPPEMALAMKSAVSRIDLDHRHGDTIRARLAAFEEKARQQVSDLLMIDGAIWKRDVEPCWRSEIFRGVVRPTSAISFARRRPGEYYHDTIEIQAFGADQLEQAAAMAALADRPAVIEGGIEILMPEAMSMDFAAMEIDRAARNCVLTIEEMIQRQPRDPAYFMGLPTKLIVAYADLKESCGRAPMDYSAAETLEAPLLAYADALEELEGASEFEWLTKYGPGPHVFRSITARWREGLAHEQARLPSPDGPS